MLKLNFTPLKLLAISGLLWISSIESIQAQTGFNQSQDVSLENLSFFRNPGRSWQLVTDVKADLKKVNALKLEKGTGILVNLPDKKHKGADLITNLEHGDLELELDYLMAKGSNSGIYFQGRYELQLEDSWGNQTVSASNNGGMYERWDDSQPNGQKGYEGYAPRQNVSRAPGLWQHLKVSFQAPRFDASGKKVENAKMVQVDLNGVMIHEDLELLGPTRGTIAIDEKATGPLRFQGDHGAVAFRNLKVTLLTNKPANNNREGNVVDPIFVDAPVNTILRSFMQLPDMVPVVHAVSVGSPKQVHYTYDLDKGAIIQVWRGGFLDATPMWHNRGNGTSRPQGTVQRFGKPVFTIAKLSSPQTTWATDTTGSSYRPKGYVLDKNDLPTFQYYIFGAKIADAIRVLENGQGFHRELTIQQGSGDMYARLAAGSAIEEQGKGMYLIDGKAYYLQLENTNGAKPIIRAVEGGKELIVPVRDKLSYSVLF